MKTRILILLLSSMTAGAHAQVFQPRSGVQFYFSDAGGTSDRLTTDLVTGPDWTGEYDVYAKNTRAETIHFDAGLFMVGYARTNGPGQAAQILPGTDRITILDPSAAGSASNINPNIPIRATWFVGNTLPSLVGGSLAGSSATRPYGLNVPMDPVNGTPVSIAPAESLFLARIAFRDNGLFLSQGSHDLVLYDDYVTPANYGTTSLFYPQGSNFLVYHDGPNWEANSRLRLVAVPEPSTLLVLSLSAGLLAYRRRKRG